MKHQSLLTAIEQRSGHHHLTLKDRQAKIMALTQRIHQVGGMVELARQLPNPRLAKALHQHCQALAKQRAIYQQGG